MSDEKIKYFSEKMAEIEKLKRELLMKEGQFQDEFGPWIKSYMGTESFTLIDVIKKSREPGLITL